MAPGEQKKIVDTVREPLLVLHEDLRVQSANLSFYDAFNAEPAQTEGRMVYELSNGQWDIPELRRLLSEILPNDGFFEDFEIQNEFPGIGHRVMLLNARRSITCSSSCSRSRTSPNAGGRSRSGTCWWAS